MSYLDSTYGPNQPDAGGSSALSGWSWDNDLSAVPSYEFDADNSSGGIVGNDFQDALSVSSGALVLDLAQLYNRALVPGASFFGRVWISAPLHPSVIPDLSFVINHPDSDRNASAGGTSAFRMFAGFAIVRTTDDGSTPKNPTSATGPRSGFYLRATQPGAFLAASFQKWASAYTSIGVGSAGPFLQCSSTQSARAVSSRFSQGNGHLNAISGAALDSPAANDFEVIQSRDYDRPVPSSDRWRLALEVESVGAPAGDQFVMRVPELNALGVMLPGA